MNLGITERLQTLGLTEFEYNEIVKRLSREPNELELYLYSAMWSEHCGYKHSKKYLSKLPGEKSLFRGENSGGVRVRDHIIFFKTESHNHPSAVEPYQGAATGIGGILRDILAMNARPIALLNSLKFGSIVESTKATVTNGGKSKADKEIRRNRYLLNSVAEGISDYGNSVGVPTIGGEVSFNECFNLSPLVNVMAVGLCHKNRVKTAKAKKNSYVVLIGSLTGRDGLFGAAFASKELENNSENRLSVQIGDPYAKKNVIEATLEILKSKNVYSAQDLGAAGLLSSTSEMAAKGKCAIDLYLDFVPVGEKNMAPYEIMLSESQERMVFCANKQGVDEIKQVCKKYELNAAVIGQTRAGETYNLYYNGVLAASVPVKSLTEPVLYDLKPEEPLGAPQNTFRKLIQTKDTKSLILKMLSSPEFGSKGYVYRRYDSTVGVRTLKNPHSLGVAPLYIFETGDTVGFSMDSNENSSCLNPYQGAFNLIFESFRNAVSSGFEPLGITNCLNFADPDTPKTAHRFIRTIDGMKDALNLLKIPVVSGNVSFYNNDVFPTPVVGMLSILRAKSPIYAEVHPGETVFLIGKQISGASNLGGSLYQKLFFDYLGGSLDTVDFGLENKLKKAIFHFKNKGLISGAIDVSKGGCLGSLLIMLFNTLSNSARSLKPLSGLGFKGNFEDDIDKLFGEITGRYLISTPSQDSVTAYLVKNKIPFQNLGNIDTTGVLDFGFAKITMDEAAERYFGALEKNML